MSSCATGPRVSGSRRRQAHDDHFPTFEIDLTRPEDEILAGMKGNCRRSVRKAEKDGVIIEAASDPELRGDYYAQLVDVFAKQSRVRPTASIASRR